MVRQDVFSLILPLTFAACSSNSGAAPLPPGIPPAAQPIVDSVGRLAAAWNAGSGDAWGAEYWPDGSLTNILGMVFPTAAAVGAVTSQILAGPFKGSVFVSVLRRLRFIGTDAAIVETDISVTNFHALPPGVTATKAGLLLTRLTHVFQNNNGVWKIEASQNTAVAPM